MIKSIHTKEFQELIERLRSARMEACLTQVQVAKKLKKPQSYVSSIESGQQRIDVIELKMLARLYKKDIVDIIK